MDASRARKDALFEAIALMGKGFASPVRLELLDLLAQAPRTVQELARASEQSTANTSQHLQALQAAGLVSRRREGRRRERFARHAQRLEEGWPEWNLERQPKTTTEKGTKAA